MRDKDMAHRIAILNKLGELERKKIRPPWSFVELMCLYSLIVLSFGMVRGNRKYDLMMEIFAPVWFVGITVFGVFMILRLRDWSKSRYLNTSGHAD